MLPKDIAAVLALAAVAACGRLGFDPTVGDNLDASSGVADASGDGLDGATDSADAGGTELLGPFGPPAIVGPLASGFADDDPSATGDLLELYFNSNRSGGDDIWVSTRANIDAPWQAPTLVAELSSASEESTPQVSSNGLAICLSSDRAGGPGGRDIWCSERADRSELWSAPVVVAELSSALNDTGPAAIPSQLMMVLNSNRAGGAFDMYLATRTSPTGTWDTPAPIVELNTADAETGSSLTGEGLHIVFSSTRPGGMGGADLYTARRDDITESFEASIPLPELNSSSRDTDAWISPDGSTILFSSDRSGNAEIYEATAQ